MNNTQLKNQFFPEHLTGDRPVFTWQKTANIGDDHVIWWLYYGYAEGGDTLCCRFFHPRSAPLAGKRRKVVAFHLRELKAQVRRDWRARFPAY